MGIRGSSSGDKMKSESSMKGGGKVKGEGGGVKSESKMKGEGLGIVEC